MGRVPALEQVGLVCHLLQRGLGYAGAARGHADDLSLYRALVSRRAQVATHYKRNFAVGGKATQRSNAAEVLRRATKESSGHHREVQFCQIRHERPRHHERVIVQVPQILRGHAAPRHNRLKHTATHLKYNLSRTTKTHRLTNIMGVPCQAKHSRTCVTNTSGVGSRAD